MTPNLIRQAAIVLSNLLEFSGPADAKLSEFFRNNRDLGTKERAFVAESVYGVLRRLRFLSTVKKKLIVKTHDDDYLSRHEIGEHFSWRMQTHKWPRQRVKE